MPQPRGPTGPLHPRTSPMGTVPASQTHEIWGDMLEPSPKVPCGASVSRPVWQARDLCVGNYNHCTLPPSTWFWVLANARHIFSSVSFHTRPLRKGERAGGGKGSAAMLLCLDTALLTDAHEAAPHPRVPGRRFEAEYPQEASSGGSPHRGEASRWSFQPPLHSGAVVCRVQSENVTHTDGGKCACKFNLTRRRLLEVCATHHREWKLQKQKGGHGCSLCALEFLNMECWRPISS